VRAVNLLPSDAQSARSDTGRAPLFAAVGGVAVVTAAAVFLAFSASGSIDQRKGDLALTEAAVAYASRDAQPGVPSGLVVQERTDRVAALAAALSSRVPMDRLLHDLSYVLPEDAWLTGLSATAPESSAASGTAPGGSAPSGGAPAQGASGAPGVTIQGVTYSQESVARVLSRLAVLPVLDDVRLQASARVQLGANTAAGATSKVKPKKKSVVTFTITASLPTGGRS
jgi:Tfp pilus assembly protein PilN